MPASEPGSDPFPPRGSGQDSRRRRRLALLAVLLAFGIGGLLLAPGLIQVRGTTGEAVPPGGAAPPVPVPHLVTPPWGVDFSLGPLLEMIEKALRIPALDARRPVRILQLPAPQDHSDDILLGSPSGGDFDAPPLAGTAVAMATVPARAPGPSSSAPTLPPGLPRAGPIGSGPETGLDRAFGDPAETSGASTPASVPESGSLALLVLAAFLGLGAQARPVRRQP